MRTRSWLATHCLFILAGAQSVILSGSSTISSFASASSSAFASASSSSSSSTAGYSGVPRGSITNLPSGVTYLSYSSTITLTSTTRPRYGSMSSSSGISMAANATSSSGNSSMTSTASTTTDSQTLLGGTRVASSTTISGNATASASSTSSSAEPTNTTPCNNYPEFCSRQWSNITMVAAHNSPFDVQGNAASNQLYGSTIQLNDGIRLLQTETHFLNSTPYLCHSSCDLLNVGTLEAWLSTLNTWVEQHPYDVITLLIGNQDYKDVSLYVDPFTNSGITRWVYTPSKIPMSLGDWPTLSYLILTHQRVIVFMDYDANQTKVPWILDEFSQMWETPFNPTDNSFPCTVQRPPNLSAADAKNRLYLLNNNLNTEITLLGQSILVPNTVELNVTNAANGTGSLGASTQGCVNDWGRAPNFLDVDYYNIGNGSVFEVAAKWNNVTYNRPCCGTTSTSAASPCMLEVVGRAWLSVAIVVVLTVWMMM